MAFDVRIVGNRRPSWFVALCSGAVRVGDRPQRRWVEVDETLVGGLEEGVAGRQTESKVLVAIAAEADGPGIGRIRMRVIEDASAASLHPFVQDCVEPGSLLHTDGWQGYSGLDQKGYQREVTVLRGRRKEASTLMLRVHRIAGLLKRWLLGVRRPPPTSAPLRPPRNLRPASIAKPTSGVCHGRPSRWFWETAWLSVLAYHIRTDISNKKETPLVITLKTRTRQLLHAAP